MDSFKSDVWGLFSSEEQLQLIDKSRALLREKLTSAVFMSGTYELDEGAISNAARQAMSGSTSRTSLNHSTNKYHSNTVGGGGGLPPYVSSSTTRINVNASQSNNNATPSRSTNAGSVWGHGAGGVSGLNQRGPTTTAMDHLTQSSGSFHVGPTMTPEHSAAASNNVIARRLSQGAGLAAVQRFDEEDDDDEVDYFPNRGQGTSHNNNNVAKMNQNFAAATKQPTPLYGSSGGVGGALPSQHSVANSGVLLRGGGGGGHHSTTLFSPSKTDTVEIGSPLEQRPAGGTAAAAAARNTASQAPPPPPANPNSLLGALPPLPVRNVSPMPTPQRLGVFQRTTLVEDDIESEDLTNTPRQQHQKQGGGGGGGGGTTTGSRAGGGAPVHRSKDLDNLMTELFPK